MHRYLVRLSGGSFAEFTARTAVDALAQAIREERETASLHGVQLDTRGIRVVETSEKGIRR